MIRQGPYKHYIDRGLVEECLTSLLEDWHKACRLYHALCKACDLTGHTIKAAEKRANYRLESGACLVKKVKLTLE